MQTDRSIIAGTRVAIAALCALAFAAARPTATYAQETTTLTVIPDGSGTVTSDDGQINCPGDCSGTYGITDVVTLTAVAADGWTFTSWSGAACTGTGPCDVLMSVDRTVTATFTQQSFTLTVNRNTSAGGTVTSNPAGIDCGSDCSESYLSGTEVVLTAAAAGTPAPGWVFAGWTGAGCSGTGTCTVTMSQAQTVTATFNPTLAVSRNPSAGGTVTGTGINCGSDCSESYALGTDVVLTANPTTSPAPGWVFSGWSGTGISCPGTGTCTVDMAQPRTVTANFTQLFTLTVAKNGQGTVTSDPAGIDCGADCSEPYQDGTSVQLTAVAAGGWTFTGWSGTGISCSGTGPCTVSMTQARTVTATFTQQTFLLTVNRNTSAGGTVTSDLAGIDCGSDCSESYGSGTVVVLTATAAGTPAPGWVFAGWTGAGCSGTGTCTVTMNQAQTVTATFNPTLSVSRSPTTGGTVTGTGINCGSDCSESYALGTDVVLTANPTTTPAPGWVFSGWSGTGISCPGTGTCTVDMTQPRAVTANFTQLFTLTVTKNGQGTVTSNPAGIDCGSDCSEPYEDGTSVELTAVAGNGWTFTGWSGAGISCTGTGPCTVSMTATRTVTATFTQQTFTLTVNRNTSAGGTVTSDPAGIECGADCSESYASGTSVELTATANPGWVFASWGGTGISCPGTGTCTVSMTQARTVTATFNPTLTVARNPTAGGTVTGTGINCGSDCTESYALGTDVVLTANPTTTPAPGWVFDGWSGTGISCPGTGTCTVDMAQPRTVTANFTQLFTLTVAKNGQGTVTSDPAGINCGADCSEPYENGTSVELTAVAAGGWTFTGWSGTGISCTGTGPCTVSMTTARTVTATFAQQTFTLSVTVTGGGTVTSNPGGINCTSSGGAGCSATFASGTPVTLNQNASTGWAFNAWGGECTGSGTCSVTMTQNRSVSATFNPQLAVTVTGSGTVTSTPAGINCTSAGGAGCTVAFANGTTVTLNAAPGTDFVFGSWGGACTTSPCSVLMNQPRSVSATFLQQFTLTLNKNVAAGGTVTSSPVGINCGLACTTDTGDYTDGTEVTLTATPADGWNFTGWSGACTGTGSCVVEMTGDQTVTATFAQQTFTLSVSVTGGGTVTSDPAGITCTSSGGPGCSGTFTIGTTVTLNQNASSNWAFSAWGGACTGSGTCSVSMTQNRTVSATFNPQLAVTVTGSGTVTSTPPGINCTSSGGAGCTASFTSATTVTLNQNPGTDFVFGTWGGNCSGSGTCSVSMTAPRTVSATFLELFTLTLNKNAAAGGTVSSNPAGINCGTGCATDTGEFADGTSVTLTATRAGGWTFTGWSGSGFSCPGTGPCTVSMTVDRTVTANFIQTFTLTVARNPTAGGSVTGPGINCGSDCTQPYDDGTSVTLTATADPGWVFDSWTGCTGATNSCTFTMTGDLTVTANFTQLFTLSVTVNGSGTVTSNPAGINCPGDCSEPYRSGTSVTLTPTPANSSWVFTGWSGACTGTGPCTVTMTQSQSVTATFTQLFTLTVSVTGQGTVTSSPAGINCTGSGGACSATFLNGTIVTLNQSAANDWEFGNWGGFCSGSGSCSVTMTQNRSVSATFLQLFTLTVNKTGNGTITSTPAGISCGAGCTTDTGEFADGTSVTVSAEPASGWAFTGWGGACQGVGSCVVGMTGDRTVTATFKPILTVDLNGDGSVTSADGRIDCPAESCSGIYDFGTRVILTATPAEGEDFDGWSGCDETDGSVCTLDMTGARFVTANFFPTSTLSVTVAITGIDAAGTVTSSPLGIDCPEDCTHDYRQGEPVTLTAHPAQFTNFTGWTGACSGTGQCQVTMSENRSVTATFNRPDFTLTVSIDPDGDGTGTVTSEPPGIDCSGASGPDCSETYPNGTSVELFAAPGADGSVFNGWAGACTGTGACSVQMTATRSVSAEFRIGHALTITIGSQGSGTVTSSPAGIACPTDCSEIFASQTAVSLSATPAAGNLFWRWGGDASGSTTPLNLTIESSQSIVAEFLGILTITEPGLRGGLLGASYADTVEVSGGTANKMWELVSGTLPPNLTLAAETGIISGTAVAIGNYPFTLRVVSEGFEAQKPLAIRISEPQDVEMTAVVDELLVGTSNLTPDQLNYLDLIGNANGRFDIGDFRAFVLNNGGAAGLRAAGAVSGAPAEKEEP